jgi:RNAse (barnase) inhibitor barstar
MQFHIIDAIPDDLIEKKGDKLFELVESQYNYMQSHIPNIPTINPNVFSTGTALTTFSCVEALDIIKNDPEYPAHYNDVIQQYESSQNDQERINKIKSMLDNISKDLSKKFIETIDLHKKYQIDLIDNTTFANSLRNLIFKFQGELHDIINKKFNLSKQKFKWDSLCDYLAKNGKASIEYKQLKNMKPNYDNIMNILSNILKNRNNQTKGNISIIYHEIIDFIYSVLNLISFN